MLYGKRNFLPPKLLLKSYLSASKSNFIIFGCFKVSGNLPIFTFAISDGNLVELA